jgi:hypothetical protein
MQMPESPVVLVGDVIKTRPTFAKKDKPSDPSREDGGVRVAIFSDVRGRRGATEVKLTAQQVASLGGVPPLGSRVAYLVQFGMYAIDGNKGVTCELVAPVDGVTVQHVLDHVTEPAATK